MAIYVHFADNPVHHCAADSTAAGNMGICYFFVYIYTVFAWAWIIHSLSDARQPSVVLRETVFIAAAYPASLDVAQPSKHITAALQIIANICFFIPLGAFVARLHHDIPSQEISKSQPLNAEPVKNNLANHFLAGCIDAVAIMLIASVSAMILRVYAPAIYQISPQAILILWWIAWEWIVPKICHGWTFGRYLVGVEKRKKTSAT